MAIGYAVNCMENSCHLFIYLFIYLLFLSLEDVEDPEFRRLCKALTLAIGYAANIGGNSYHDGGHTEPCVRRNS